MEIQSVMETFAEWIAATNPNGNLFSMANGVQSQALSLTTTTSHSIQNSSLDNVQSTGIGKTLAVRCVVESVANLQHCDLPYSNHGSGQVEVDRQASVPVHTVFHNLVEAVLQIFGYPKETAVTAKGSIIIENWKPIKLEKVAQNPQKTVYDILGQISSFVTLKIQILRTSSCANAILTQMKEKLLQLLMVQNRDHILSSGCPLDQITLKSMLRGVDYGTTVPSDDVIRKFEQWISSQYRQALRPLPYPSPLAQFPFPMGSPSALHHDKAHIGSNEDRVHPALQTVQSQYPTQKTRMRTSFDAEHELPRLQKWFSENQHPSRQQIMQYVNELNSLESRRGRKPLDVNNVVYWFKNARAAQKRTEGRNVSNAPNNSINGYRSDSHSPCDTAVTSKESLGSVHESCDEDDVGLDDDNRSDGEGEEGDDSLDARPSGSPVAPLSLTTHKANKRSRSSSPVDKIKQEPPDKPASSERLTAHAQSTPISDGSKKVKSESPAGQEFDTDEEDVDDDISEPESIHNKTSESESRNSIFSNPSPLSLIPRSMNNSVFPMVPSTMFNHNFSMFTPYIQSIQNMNMNRSVSVSHSSPQPHNTNNHTPYSDDKRKRNRTFIDPVTEVPCLEKWFHMNTHPSHGLIMQYTEDLNSMAYRQKFPKLEPKNVQFWFKNRRAKCKRLKSSLYESITSNNNLSPQEHYHLAAALAGENYRMQE